MIIVLITILRTFVYVQNHNSKNNNNIHTQVSDLDFKPFEHTL